MKRFLAGLPGALALAAMVSAALAAVPAPAGPVPDGDVYTIGVTGMT